MAVLLVGRLVVWLVWVLTQGYHVAQVGFEFTGASEACLEPLIQVLGLQTCANMPEHQTRFAPL